MTSRPGFGEETAQGRLVTGEMIGEDLDRHVPAAQRIVCEQDVTHAPLAEDARDLIFAERLPERVPGGASASGRLDRRVRGYDGVPRGLRPRRSKGSSAR